MSTVEWARPIVLQQDAYQKRSFGWNLTIVLLMAASSSVYSLLVSPNIGVISLIILFMGLISVMFKDTVLNPIELSLPDVYCVSLVRIIDLSLELETSRTTHTQVQDRFYDALANLIKQIDTDLYQLRNNLAAWKTTVDLRLLRIYLLKFTTAATDPVSAAQAVGRPDGQLTTSMRETLRMLADFFHRFYSIETMTDTLQIDVESLNELQDYRIRPRSRGMLKLLRKWHSLPPPLNTTLLILIGSAVVWLIPNYDLFNFSARITVTVTLIIGVVAWFREPIRRWLRSVLEGTMQE